MGLAVHVTGASIVIVDNESCHFGREKILQSLHKNSNT